ncbi:MAG TPA: HIT family protein [Ktedonobacterales bacterium]|nr:HIT family protein [Ktedonobacterales bacterium]
MRDEHNWIHHENDLVYQDELVTAFVAPHWWPNNKGHVIIIPNDHYENLYELPRLYLHRVHDIAQAIALTFKHVYRCHGVSTRQHNEPAGNQDVWHYHLHVFPRYDGDNLYLTRRSREVVPPEERRTYAEKLKRYLGENPPLE